MIPAGFQVGVGYRRELHEALLDSTDDAVDFLELAPENYLGLGGEWRRRLNAIRERWPLITHGLSLSLGGQAPLDHALLEGLRVFCAEVQTPWHSDHLCLSSVPGSHSHELLPLEFTPETARRTAARVREVADALGRPMAVENISAYGRWPSDQMSEGAFVTQVVRDAECGLLLDVNNILVNALNFHQDPVEILQSFPLDRVVQIHVAGFEPRGEDLVIDTHGAAVDERIWPLLATALEAVGPVPVLLERDNNIPDLDVLLEEVARIRSVGREIFGGVTGG